MHRFLKDPGALSQVEVQQAVPLLGMASGTKRVQPVVRCWMRIERTPGPATEWALNRPTQVSNGLVDLIEPITTCVPTHLAPHPAEQGGAATQALECLHYRAQSRYAASIDALTEAQLYPRVCRRAALPSAARSVLRHSPRTRLDDPGLRWSHRTPSSPVTNSGRQPAVGMPTGRVKNLGRVIELNVRIGRKGRITTLAALE